MQRHGPHLETVFVDDDMVVVNKPVGWLTHKTGLCSDRVTCMSLLRDQLGRWVYPVHRLDRATSGLLMFALSPEVAETLGRAMQERRIQKTYLAVVRGHVKEGGVMDKPLASGSSSLEQSAVTFYQPLATVECPWPVRPYASARYTLLSLKPMTGRTHQLRRHMRSLSRPIIGDTKFGDGAHNAAFAERLGIRRLMLHARDLSFVHPRTGSEVRLEAGADEDFRAALALFQHRAPCVVMP